MKIKLICLGKIREPYLIEGIKEYLKRLQGYAKVEIIELSETKIGAEFNQKQIDLALTNEASKIEKYLDGKDFVIILDVNGQTIDNYEYVEMINTACLNGYSTFSFIIGSSHGIATTIKAKSNFNWSFSKLVFTHQMIRLLCLEQIYRGFKIMAKEPYHK